MGGIHLEPITGEYDATPLERATEERIIELFASGLPTYAQLEQTLLQLGELPATTYSPPQHILWPALFRANGIFFIPTSDFVDSLAKELHQRAIASLVEICAGGGHLARHLREKGIEVLATDSTGYSTGGGVVRARHDEALAVYRPSAVLGTLMHPSPEIGMGILQCPDVKYFVDIDEPPGGCSWMASDFAPPATHRVTELSKPGNYTLWTGDIIVKAPKESYLTRKPRVHLFERHA